MQRFLWWLLASMTIAASAQAAKGDVWLRCALTETLTTTSQNGLQSPTREDFDRVYIYIFNPRRESLRRFDDGQLKDLNGVSLFDGVNRTGSVVVTPATITYNYSVAPDAAEFSQIIDRTTLALQEKGSSYRETGSRLPTQLLRSWAGSGQCEKMKPEPTRKRQI